ncbi:MAG: hypothetical protein IT481_10000 [Gammaproteobacteria bacterium]|nr:hypothetical protein [Gammaproteobacteria bacterium]
MRASRVLLAWCAIIVAESVHGTLRELLLAPRIGSLLARQLAVFTGIAIIFVIALSLARWMGWRTRRECLLAGLAWVMLTVAFEIALGRLVFGHGWSRILEDYDPSRGGLMSLGLAAMALTPWLAARLRGQLDTAADR